MSTPIVSVLIPVHNAAATLQETLESLLSQTFQHSEFVVVNDGSTDQTAAILHSYVAGNPRIRALNLPRVGLIESLNRGLALCSGEFIARMDGDDVALPDRLALQVALFREQPSLSVVGCLVECFPTAEVREGFRVYVEWLNSLVTPEDIAREIFIESPLAHPSVMMRRAEVLDLGGYRDYGWPEDYDLWLRYHAAGKLMAKVQQVLLMWREHPHRLTRTDARYSVENFLRAKAHYLALGPLRRCDAVIVWGAGQIGRRVSKHLIRRGCPIVAFLDIDPKKIGGTLRGKPIYAADELPNVWNMHRHPVLLMAVASRGARAPIRERLCAHGLVEARDYWCIA